MVYGNYWRDRQLQQVSHKKVIKAASAFGIFGRRGPDTEAESDKKGCGRIAMDSAAALL